MLSDAEKTNDQDERVIVAWTFFMFAYFTQLAIDIAQGTLFNKKYGFFAQVALARGVYFLLVPVHVGWRFGNGDKIQ